MVNLSDRVEMKKEIKEYILSLADTTGPIINDFGEDDPILELGILDSPAVIDLVCWYEKTYQITLDTNEISVNNLGTLSKMVDFVFIKKNVR